MQRPPLRQDPTGLNFRMAASAATNGAQLDGWGEVSWMGSSHVRWWNPAFKKSCANTSNWDDDPWTQNVLFLWSSRHPTKGRERNNKWEEITDRDFAGILYSTLWIAKSSTVAKSDGCWLHWVWLLSPFRVELIVLYIYIWVTDKIIVILI